MSYLSPKQFGQLSLPGLAGGGRHEQTGEPYHEHAFSGPPGGPLRCSSCAYTYTPGVSKATVADASRAFPKTERKPQGRQGRLLDELGGQTTEDILNNRPGRQEWRPSLDL